MKRNLRLLAIPTLVLGTAICSYAEKVSLSDAQSLAIDFVVSRTGQPAGNVTLEPVYTGGSEKSPAYYVFNLAGNKGFVMVSAESSTTTSILGYSFKNGYPVKEMPDGMKWMVAGLEKEIKAAPSLQSSGSLAELRKRARKSGESSAQKELATPKWSQEAPFNAMIPGRPLVGCVGTAMATIMKYHEYPKAGRGGFGGVDFDTDYDWSNMRMDNYRYGYDSSEADAVATLMYHVSKSIDTQYAMSGSSAYEVRVPGALTTYFGYDPGVSYKKRQEVGTQEEWDAIIRREIDENRPVLYCGQDVTAGHAFVCDGYDGNYFHFNWGWGGAADGYFVTSSLNPTVSREHHYNNLNTIIYNIRPASGSVAEWSPIHITSEGNQTGIGSDMTDLSSGKKFKVRVGNLKNVSYNDFKGKIAVALTDENGLMKALLSRQQDFTMQSMGYLYNGYTDFNDCVLPAGVSVASGDRVRLMTLADGQSLWLPVAGELPTVNELDPASSAPAVFSVNFPSSAGVTLTGESTVIRGWDYSFTVKALNPQEDVVTVKANGITLTPSGETYRIANVRENQEISILVQKASEVKEKRSVWVGVPGTLSSVIPDSETGTIKELTVFGSIDARDFAFMRDAMDLRRLDISGVNISANGNDQANAIPREAFRGEGALKEVILPKSINRLNNGCFRQCGITTVSIPSGVSKYEYNIFVGCTALRDIYVGRSKAEFINWCVLSGVKVDLVTLHVPDEGAVANYSKAENWSTIKNIIVDRPQTSDEILFAVMDNSEVKFESEFVPGKLGKGDKVSFKATHIADNDNRLEVYANSTRLSSDAEGNYSVTLNDNTIIHFDLAAPLAADPNKSVWTLTGKNGSIGMFSDAVNVIPGSEFSVRLNALNVPKNYDQMYWGMALTDSKGNIKEFISPVTVWNAGSADNFRLSVNCKVSESTVREGNMLRLVTSFNKKNWNLVCGGSSDIVDALPALNNMTPVYNITVPNVENATVSGVTPTAVRGRDMTLNVTPTSAAYRVNVSLNGKEIVKGAPSVSYPFVALEDMEFAINVYDPREIGSVTYNVKPNELYKAVTAETVAANVIVTGEVYSKDLSLAFRQDFAARTIKRLDLSGVKIVADVLTPTSENDKFENFIPSNLLYNPTGVTAVVPVVEEIILPNTVTRIADGAFTNCSRLKEITLPLDLKTEKVEVGRYPSGGIKYGYSLGSQVFKGCTSMTTIRIPGAPSTVNGRVVVSHYNPTASTNSEYNKPDYTLYDLGFRNSENYADGSKITVIVPQEYLGAYKTPYNNWDYGNPWVAQGYNILSENPVYGVDFDPTRVKVTEGTDVSKMAEFLSDNVALESMSTEGKIMLTHPEIKCRIFDNGVEISAASDGSIPVTFYNPAKNNEKAGNHRIDVVYTHDVAFSSTSSLFEISTPEVANEANYSFHEFDTTNPLAPVLRDVAENSLVRFKVSFKDDNEGLEARVMKGAQELSADEEGYYSLSTTAGSSNIEIFAVPGNGATINAEELTAIKPEESAAVTSIAFAGEMTADELAYAVGCFENLENLDLSGFTGDIPENAFSGMESLTTVVLPEVEEISANMFNGCVNLQSVDIPATVGSVGEGAFKDCGALEKITLTGVSNIGDGAFDGCGNLTVITLLSSSADPSSNARRRSKKNSGRIGSDAFKGVNPNCIVILDDGVAAPAGKANYIKASIGTVLETTLDGTQEEREGRIYTADSDITFIKGYPLAIPHKFNIGEGAEVSLEAETGDWTQIVVPFDVETVTDGVKKIALALTVENEEVAENNSVYGLDSESGKLHRVERIEANIPYFFYTSENGTTTFRTTKGTVATTPAEICVNGKDYSLHATYREQDLPAEGLYFPDVNSYAFLPADSESEEGKEPVVTVRPFTVYASSSLGMPEILTELPGVEKPLETGVEDSLNDSFRVAVENGIAVIYTAESCVETVYTADGKAVFTVTLTEGRNELGGLSSGIYVIRNIKFAF